MSAEPGAASIAIGEEVHHRGDRYDVLEMVPTSGNRLLRFSSKDRGEFYAAFVRELGGRLSGESAAASLPRLTAGRKSPDVVPTLGQGAPALVRTSRRSSARFTRKENL